MFKKSLVNWSTSISQGPEVLDRWPPPWPTKQRVRVYSMFPEFIAPSGANYVTMRHCNSTHNLSLFFQFSLILHITTVTILLLHTQQYSHEGRYHRICFTSGSILKVMFASSTLADSAAASEGFAICSFGYAIFYKNWMLRNISYWQQYKPPIWHNFPLSVLPPLIPKSET